MDAKALIEKLRSEMKRKGLTSASVAASAGCQPGNLRRMLSGDSPNPRIRTLLRVLEGLRWPLVPFSSWDARELVNAIDQRRVHLKLSVGELSARSGVPGPRLKKLLHQKTPNFALTTLISLCDAVNLALDIETDASGDGTNRSEAGKPGTSAPPNANARDPSDATEGDPGEQRRSPDVDTPTRRKGDGASAAEPASSVDDERISIRKGPYSFSARVRRARDARGHHGARGSFAYPSPARGRVGGGQTDLLDQLVSLPETSLFAESLGVVLGEALNHGMKKQFTSWFGAAAAEQMMEAIPRTVAAARERAEAEAAAARKRAEADAAAREVARAQALERAQQELLAADWRIKEQLETFQAEHAQRIESLHKQHARRSRLRPPWARCDEASEDTEDEAKTGVVDSLVESPSDGFFCPLTHDAHR